MPAAIEHVLAQLPPCAEQVIVASHRYNAHYIENRHFRCEISVPAQHIAAFWRAHWRNLGGTNHQVAAGKALPVWLESAPQDGCTCDLPISFIDFVTRHTSHFIQTGVASIVCNDCGPLAQAPSMQFLPLSSPTDLATFRSLWHCPNGHLIHQADHDICIFRSTAPQRDTI